MVRTCCIFGCSVRSHDRKGNRIAHGISFYVVPAWKKHEGDQVSDVSKRRRLAWLAAVRRADLTFSSVTPKHLLVCSRHFISGKPAYEMDETNPDWAPTLHLGHSEVRASQSDRYERRLKRKKRGEEMRGDKALYSTKKLEARLEKVDFSPRTLFSCYCFSDDRIQFYTKFPSESVFRIFWESIEPSASRLVSWTKAQKIGIEAVADPSPARHMPLIDEFLMYSFRVAAGMKEQLIADMFKVSISTVSRVTITWANYLFIVLSSLNMWIGREKVKASMPQRFLKHSPNVRVILDYTEIALEAASSLTLQLETTSAYKNCTTLKGLIGVAPNGLVTFVSQLYTGCLSDKDITKISGILPLLEPGDEVMADKGLLIQGLFDKVGAKLTMPPFGHQFSETEETQAIAHLRIIVERALSRIKCFHIWDSPVPITLIRSVNQIWHNCCVLANYHGPFCFED